MDFHGPKMLFFRFLRNKIIQNVGIIRNSGITIWGRSLKNLQKNILSVSFEEIEPICVVNVSLNDNRQMLKHHTIDPSKLWYQPYMWFLSKYECANITWWILSIIFHHLMIIIETHIDHMNRLIEISNWPLHQTPLYPLISGLPKKF